MERRYENIYVYLDMPNGEAPGISAGDNPSIKVKEAITSIFEAGADTYGFTVSEMDVGEDKATGIVLTHEDA